MNKIFLIKYIPVAIFSFAICSGVAFAQENAPTGAAVPPSGGMAAPRMEINNPNGEARPPRPEGMGDMKFRPDQKMGDRENNFEGKKPMFDRNGGNKGDRKNKIEGKDNEKEGEDGDNNEDGDKKMKMDPKREEMLKNILDQRRKFEAKTQEDKADMQTEVNNAKDSLQKTLSSIKDERKKNSVENIAKLVDQTNKNSTQRLTNNVNSIENVLISIKSRSDKFAAEGADTTQVTTDLATATSALTEARSAIATQSAKIYTIDVSDPTKLKNIMKTTRDTFNADMKAIEVKIKAARDAAKKAADDLKKVVPKPVAPNAPVAPAETPATEQSTATTTPAVNQ